MTRRKGNNMDILHWNSDLTTLTDAPAFLSRFFTCPAKPCPFHSHALHDRFLSFSRPRTLQKPEHAGKTGLKENV